MLDIIRDKKFKAITVKESNEVYHANKKHVNNSSLKTILKSPQSFLASWNTKTESTPAMIFGSLVHELVLEPDLFKSKYIEAKDFGDLRKKENKINYENWTQSVGEKIPVSGNNWRDIHGIRESIMKHPQIKKLLEDMTPEKEQSIYFADPETGLGLRSRPDAVNVNAIVDLKTTADCSMKEFSWSIFKFGYAFQMAMIGEAVQALRGQRPGIYMFIAVEKNPPFECALYYADQDMMEYGRAKLREALTKLDECLKKDVWGSYQNEMQEISLPPTVT